MLILSSVLNCLLRIHADISCINSFLYIFFEEISYMYWIQSFLDSMENCLACCQQSFYNLWRTYESEQSFKNLWRICESEQSFYNLWRTYESEQSFNNLWRTYESEQSFKNLWRIVYILGFGHCLKLFINTVHRYIILTF